MNYKKNIIRACGVRKLRKLEWEILVSKSIFADRTINPNIVSSTWIQPISFFSTKINRNALKNPQKTNQYGACFDKKNIQVYELPT